MRNVTILLAVVVVLALAVPVCAVDTDWTGGSATDPNDFHDDDNWTGSAPPAAWGGSSVYADIGEVTGGTLAIISSDVDLRKLRVGGHIYDAEGAAEVRMAATAGTYTVTVKKPTGEGCLRIGAYGSSTQLGTFTQYGGNLVVGTHASASDISLNVGGGGYGQYTIYGGSITADLLNLGRNSGNGTFTVVGSGSTGISIDEYKMSSNSTLEFEINGYSTSGIETIVVNGAVTFAGTDSIVVDNSAGGDFAGSYTLMTWTGSETGTPSLDLPADWTWNSDDWDTDNEIVVTVPEPATMALLGIGGIGVLIRRKHR